MDARIGIIGNRYRTAYPSLNPTKLNMKSGLCPLELSVVQCSWKTLIKAIGFVRNFGEPASKEKFSLLQVGPKAVAITILS